MDDMNHHHSSAADQVHDLIAVTLLMSDGCDGFTWHLIDGGSDWDLGSLEPRTTHWLGIRGKAMFTLPLKIRFVVHPACCLAVWTVKSMWDLIFPKLIQTTYGGNFQFDCDWISTDPFQSERIGCSSRILKCHDMNNNNNNNNNVVPESQKLFQWWWQHKRRHNSDTVLFVFYLFFLGVAYYRRNQCR